MKMKKQELKELVALGEKAISGKISEATTAQNKFKLELARGQVKNLREGKTTRKLIAKLKTFMSLSDKGAK